MALIDVIRYDVNPNEFVHKVPSRALMLGTQLIVMPEQQAVFVKGGKRLDTFEPGTHTLESKNIPLLSKLVNLPFGGTSPFEAEVWYVNLLTKLDNKWGTETPIQLEDPKYKVIVHVRAFGQFGLRISDPGLFLDTLVGALPDFSVEKVISYFKGKLMSTVVSLLSQKMVKDNLSILEVPAMLDEMSAYCAGRLNDAMARYGIELVDFYFISVNAPDDDPGLQALEAAKEKAMYISTVGRDVYSFDGSMGVMDKAVSNPGSAGGMMGNTMGMGMGVTLGTAMGTQLGGMVTQLNTNLQNNQASQPAADHAVANTEAPPPPPVTHYHVLIDDVQQGPLELAAVGEMILHQSVRKDTLVWKPGMAEWAAAEGQHEFAKYFAQVPPPPPVKK